MKNYLLCILSFITVAVFAQQAGSLDSTFGANGLVTTDFGTGSDWGNSILLQPDGKIIVGGIASNAFALARYNTDGTLDSSFSSDGKATTTSTWGCAAQSAALQADGKIVLAGSISNGFNSTFAFRRYHSNGTLDNNFGSWLSFGSHDNIAYAVAIQTDGKIVLAGFADNGSDWDFAVARLNTDGTGDLGFASNGQLITSFDTGYSSEFATSVAIQTDGKIVVAGCLFSDFGIVRYKANGTLDSSFASNGKLVTDFNAGGDIANAVALQSDGKIVVVGSTYYLATAKKDFALARYNVGGTLDSSFGTFGKIATPFYSNQAEAKSLIIQPDGKIVVVGSYRDDSLNRVGTAIARYSLDGSLDGAFGINGKLTCSFDSLNIEPKSVALLQADEKIVVAGTKYGSDYAFAISRFNLGPITNCSASFVLYPDSSNQGVYYGYNQSTGNNLTYLWHFGDGDSSTLQYPSHTYAAPGQYYVCLTVSDTLNCSDTYCDSSFYVFKTEGGLMSQLNILDPNAPVGIKDIVGNFKITVYPNPATSQLNINLGGLQAEQVRIYNIDGRLVSDAKQPVNNSIDISNLATGVYVAEVKVRDAVQRVRWVKM